MKILLLANLVPYPTDNGGKIKTMSDLIILSRKYEVDLVCFYEHENIEEAKIELHKYCNNINFLPIRVTTRENMGLMMWKTLCSLFTPYSLGVYKYITKQMKTLLSSLLDKNHYKYVYCNILSMYAYSTQIRKKQSGIYIILSEQNCESVIYERMRNLTKGFVKKAFLSLEYKKLLNFEKKAVISADKVIALSQADRNELRKMCKKNIDCIVIPIGVPNYKVSKKSNKIEKGFTILFVGTLTWQPNNAGLIWFLENVIPKIAFDFNMYIVGKNPSDQVQKLAAVYDNIHVTGYVDTVDPYFSLADCMVVPLFIGSGQRVKIIESFARKMPVISTDIGAEGLGCIDNYNICIANNADDFIENINKMRNHDYANNIAKNARRLFEEQFEVAAVAKKMLSILE